MTNRFVNVIIFVKNIQISKEFYSNILGMKILQDYGTIVFFENHLVLHVAGSITKTIFKKDRMASKFKQGRKNMLIYFETNSIEELFSKIVNSNVRIIHGIEKQTWGQKVFRFYDPDNHMIEFGEPFRIKDFNE